MKRLLCVFLFLTPVLGMAAPPGVSEPPVWNPFGGHLQYVGPGNGLQPGDTYYLYNDTANNHSVYWLFTGTQACLYMNGVSQVCYTNAGDSFLLLEDGTLFLLEDGGNLILQ